MSVLQKLLQKVREFRDARDWKQFHDPKNLAEAISIESNELLELFLWKDKKQVKEDLKDENFKNELSEELADIFSFLLLMSHETGIDLSEALTQKYKKNEKKYPIEKSKGKSTKYNKL